MARLVSVTRLFHPSSSSLRVSAAVRWHVTDPEGLRTVPQSEPDPEQAAITGGLDPDVLGPVGDPFEEPVVPPHVAFRGPPRELVLEPGRGAGGTSSMRSLLCADSS